MNLWRGTPGYEPGRGDGLAPDYSFDEFEASEICECEKYHTGSEVEKNSCNHCDRPLEIVEGETE